MLNSCVYTYVCSKTFQWTSYNDKSVNDVFTDLVEKLKYSPETIVHKSIPLVNGKLAPVSWYYSLFTEKELGDALEKHNSPFPTKTFLVFKGMKSITLGASGKTLVEFKEVKKEDVDRIIKEVLSKQ